MATTTISVRLNLEDLATVQNVANIKKINKRKALQHIIHAFAANQNNNAFLKIENKIEDLMQKIEQNNYKTNTNINNAVLAAKEAKYISLYNFANRANPDVAKDYLKAAEKRARE